MLARRHRAGQGKPHDGAVRGKGIHGRNPLAQNGHVVVLENNVFMPMSPYTTLVLEAIGNVLYGAAQEAKP